MPSGGGIKRNTLGPGLRNVALKYPDVLAQALRAETEVETTEVKRRTPVDTGTLKGTIHAEGPFRQGRRIYATIVAGGPAAPYAIYVHEDPDAHHPVGQWKYIESVLMESRAYFAQRVARRAQLTQVK